VDQSFPHPEPDPPSGPGPEPDGPASGPPSPPVDADAAASLTTDAGGAERRVPPDLAAAPPAPAGEAGRAQRAGAGRGAAGRRRPAHAVSRRSFLKTATALGGLAVAAGAAGLAAWDADGAHGPARSRPVDHRAARRHAEGTTVDEVFTGTSPSGLPVPMSRRIVEENQRPGSAWWIPTAQVPRSIEGFADRVSAQVGDEVTLYVNTVAPSFHVDVIRMGYYQGMGGRIVWRSPEAPGRSQPEPTVDPTLHTVECPWTPSLRFEVQPDWVPGAYLLKLVGSGGQQQYVPLCVRDDRSTAAFVVQHSVTTWQAYNRWGGFSLYSGNPDLELSFVHAPGPTSTFALRARVVSFDRPYDWDWASGAADFIGNELPVVYDVERLGLDVTYWTDVDLHLRPELLANHRCLFSLGHDEYWSLPMRQGAAAALAAGTNLAFLGANACYRQIRLDASPIGAHRRQVCYKDAAEDPLYGVDNALVTGPSWVSPPTDWAESQLIGPMYQDIGAHADMVVVDPGHWTLAGTGLVAGQHVPSCIIGEFDRYDANFPSPPNADVVAHSLIANRNDNYSDVTWYTVPGGGGVFASGNATWVGSLSNTTNFPTNIVPAARPGVTAPLLRVMENLYSVLGSGPADATHPSAGTWRQVYAGSAAPSGPVASPTA
jgi:hypothetical protein